ncbi:MAG: helix-turn-helix domain-containing protein [Bacillota bacterium]|nr:helix-turn-helix domain-containing protein [Bacillota bacterium]
MNYEHYLLPEEASKYLRVSLSTVNELMKRNELAASNDGAIWMISRSDLEDFADCIGEREELPD